MPFPIDICLFARHTYTYQLRYQSSGHVAPILLLFVFLSKFCRFLFQTKSLEVEIFPHFPSVSRGPIRRMSQASGLSLKNKQQDVRMQSHKVCGMVTSCYCHKTSFREPVYCWLR